MRRLRRLLSRLRRPRRGEAVPEARAGRARGLVDLAPHLALCPACSEWWGMEALVRHLLAHHPSSPEAGRIRAWLAGR